jgi:hypothetical protein
MGQMVSSGTPAKLWNADPSLHGDAKVRVDLPENAGGGAVEVSAKDGTADFGATDKVGFYQAHWPAQKGDDIQSLFAVNLLNATESSIAPQSLQSTASNAVAEVTSVARVNREIWQWFAAAALGVLLLEWWAYHRRLG